MVKNFATEIRNKVAWRWQMAARRKLQKKVKAAKAARARYPYVAKPKVTAILQFFNKRKNIPRLLETLRSPLIEEVIVLDDGSVDGSFEEWFRELGRSNDFLLRSNDLHEVRMYDRALGMARGQYVCLLQDDDVTTCGDQWVRDAIALLDATPEMALLGRDALDVMMPDPCPPDEPKTYREVNGVGIVPGCSKYRYIHRPTHMHPELGLPFMYAMYVNRAPVFLRREAILRIGGINLDFAPYQCDDADLSFRVWLAGMRVGLYYCQFWRDYGIGGQRLFNATQLQVHDNDNWGKIYARYGRYIVDGSIAALLDRHNSELTARLAADIAQTASKRWLEAS